MLEYINKVSVGNIHFNESREQINSLFDVKPRIFVRTPNDTNSSDYYVELGIFVYYDENNKCDAVEMIAPAKVSYKNYSLFNKSYKEILSTISTFSSDIEEDNEGFISKSEGIGVYAPSKNEEENASPETIIFFREGYYD